MTDKAFTYDSVIYERVPIDQRYEAFNDFWLDVAYPLYDNEVAQQKLFFSFVFRMFLTFWESLSQNEMMKIKSIAAEFLKFSDNEIESHIEVLRKITFI